MAVSAQGPVASVGIGVPGLYDPATGRTRFLVNIPGPWDGHPVAGPVAAAAGVPAFLVNDARAFGLAELRIGAGRGASSMVGLTLGTGIGGVIAIDGRVHQGHDGTGGELGHQTIDPDGPWCGCGNRGCVEAFARADQIAMPCGTATAEEAVARARAGDERARDGLAQVGRYLGIGIANMVTVVSPDRVVIGGGIAAAGDLLFDPIRAELRRRVFIDLRRRGPPGTGRAGYGGRRDRGGGARRGMGVEGRRSSPEPPGGGEAARDPGVLPPALPRDRAGAPRRGSRSLKPGDPLPSDAALCREFGVSRMTARNAVQLTGRGGAHQPRAGPRQLRRRPAVPPARQQPDGLLGRDAAPRAGTPIATAAPRGAPAPRERGARPATRARESRWSP